jgi:hypothetical protein
MKTVHGDSRRGSRRGLYDIWASIVKRCTNPRCAAWPNYGGRGITLTDQWRRSYAAFRFWMGDRPSPNHTVDRVDNDGHYEPGNVRWATRSEQNRNRRRACVLQEGQKIA